MKLIIRVKNRHFCLNQIVTVSISQRKIMICPMETTVMIKRKKKKKTINQKMHSVKQVKKVRRKVRSSSMITQKET